MKKFIFRHKIIFFSAIIAFLFIFFFTPFFQSSSSPEFYPCPGGAFNMLCNLGAPVSLFSYLPNGEPIASINWEVPVIAFIIFFVILYVVLKLMSSVIRFPRKKNNLLILLVKVLILAALVYGLYFIGNIYIFGIFNF